MISCRMCVVSNVKTDDIRIQLDKLHSEVESTRRKANNARFRLIRLSEAAENLRRQAAKNLRMGQENDAREILIQKKKVMLALEKSKDRVELLDELAAKLSEAISIKEAQLVENVSSDLGIDGNDADGPVRFVSPTPGSVKNYKIRVEDQESNPLEDTFDSVNKTTTTSNFPGALSTIDFLNDVDQQLEKIEEDLCAISEHSSSLVLENEEELQKSSVPQIPEILSNIRDTRARIHNFVDKIEASS